MDNRKAAQYWLLVTSLNAAKFAIAELEPRQMKFSQKHHFLSLHNAIISFLNSIQRNASKDDKELLDKMSFENVGAMAETMSMIAQIPEKQIEWFLNECNKLVFSAVNKELAKK